MQKYVAFLRAVNVSGTGKLPMIELKKMCEDLGFEKVKTYIASGNVIFQTFEPAEIVRVAIDATLREYFGKSIGVFVRNLDDMQKMVSQNPFPDKAPNRTIAFIIDEFPQNPNEGIKHHNDEEISPQESAIFIHYGEGMGSSKLKAPWFEKGTGRNINTISKILELMKEM